jgi:hypothetical protein
MTSAISIDFLPSEVWQTIHNYTMPTNCWFLVNKSCSQMAEEWFKNQICLSNRAKLEACYSKPEVWSWGRWYREVQTGEIFGNPLRLVSTQPYVKVEIDRIKDQLTFKVGVVTKTIPIPSKSQHETCRHLHLNWTVVYGSCETIVVCFNNDLTFFKHRTHASIPQGAPWHSHDDLIAWRSDGRCYVWDWDADQSLSSFPVVGENLHDSLVLTNDFLAIRQNEEFTVYNWKEGTRLNLDLPSVKAYTLDGKWLAVYTLSLSSGAHHTLSIYDLSKQSCVFTKDEQVGLFIRFTKVYHDMLFQVTAYKSSLFQHTNDSSQIKVCHMPTQKVLNILCFPGGMIQRLWIDGLTLHVIVHEQLSDTYVENCFTLDATEVDSIFARVQHVCEKALSTLSNLLS